MNNQLKQLIKLLIILKVRQQKKNSKHMLSRHTVITNETIINPQYKTYRLL